MEMHAVAMGKNSAPSTRTKKGVESSSLKEETQNEDRKRTK
jgi:hypothetical protein